MKRKKDTTDETMARLAAQAALEPTKDGEEQSTGDVAGAFTNGNVPIDWYFDDQDPEAFRRNYPEMMHDAAVKAAMMALLFEVCALDLNVHPADTDDEEAQEVAEFVKYALCTGQGGLTALLMKMAKPALVNQFSVSELVYRTETRGRWAGKWVLSAVKSKDITNGNWSFRLDAFKNVLGIIHMQEGQTKVFDPAKFVRYACMPDYENPRACSHLRAAYRAWWVKRTVMRAWAVFAERQGLIPYGTYQSEPQKKQLEAQLAKFNARRWLAVPEGVKLGVIRYVSSESGKSQQDIIRDLDKQIFLAIRLAFLQALEGDRTGARSMGEVHETTADLMAWFLAADLASAINTQIVPRLVELNFGEDTPCPVVKLESPTEEDLVQRSQVDQALTNIGLELSKKQLREVYGRVEPEGDEDSLKKAEPPPSPFGGGGAPPFGGKPGEEPPDDEPKDGQPPKPEAKKEPDEDLAKLAADDQAWLARSYRRLLQVLESDEVALAFDPDQARDESGKWTATGATLPKQSGLPLPPKDAPGDVQQAYKDRQKAYTQMRNEKATPEARADAEARYKAATDKIAAWKAKGSTREAPKEPIQKPGRHTAATTGAKTYTNAEADYKAQAKALKADGIAQRVSFYDHEHRPAEGFADEAHQKGFTKRINLVGSEGTRMQRQFGGMDRLKPISELQFYAGNNVPDSGRSRRGGLQGLYTYGSREMRVGVQAVETIRQPTVGGRAFTVDKSMAGTFRHEFGHHVMGQGDFYLQRDWAEVHASKDRHGWRAAVAVSKYADTNAHEHFAEAFCAWTHPNYKRGSMPSQTEAFFQKHFPRKKGG